MEGDRPSSLLPSVDPFFDEADEIADDLDLVDVGLGDLQSAESVFNHDHQFKTIEPVGPEISNEVRVIGHTFEVHVQMLGDESSDLDRIKASSLRSRYSRNRR